MIAIDRIAIQRLDLIALGLGSAIAVGAMYGYFQQEVTRRQLAETILRQQTDRERLVNQIAQQIRQSLDLNEVLATTVKEVQGFLQADRVLIYRLNDDGTGCAIHETVSSPYPSILGQTFPEEVFPQKYHQAYSRGKTRAINDVTQAEIEPCLVDFVQQFGVQAKLVVPIIQVNCGANYLWGLLIAHQCSEARTWGEGEVELMKQLATQVAIAIQQSELYYQLQQLNTQLEQRVRARTTELATTNIALQDEIIERQRTENALRLLQSVVVNTNDAVIITEAESIDEPGPRILYVNEAFTRITGYTPEEVLGKTPRILQGPKTDQGELQRLRSALVKWESVTVEVINYRKDGSEFWNEFSLVPVADEKGWYTHWIAVQRDTTARKRADEIRLALEREKELSALKTRFFSMASHEFRTPLSTALAAAQVLENSQVEWDNHEKRLRNLHRIQDAVRNMVQLLDDILTINRAESGNLAFNPVALNLELYCRHFVEEMQLSAGGQHQITFTCKGKAGAMHLDEKLLRSILSNLLSNSIKYTPNGGHIWLTLVFEARAAVIGVRDEGIGIPVEDRRRLFEPFHRGRNVRTVPGTGLGLVVVKKCVDLHQGTIEMISEVGVGTTCQITLPYGTL
jgi:PAS domain S-box-containing protein